MAINKDVRQSTAARGAIDPFLFEPVKALWDAVNRLNDLIGISADQCGCGYCYCHGGGCNCAMCLAMPQLGEELGILEREEAR